MYLRGYEDRLTSRNNYLFKLMDEKEKLKEQCRESCKVRDMQGVVNALASLYVLWRKDGVK